MKYPLQTYKIKRSNQTLGIDFQLFVPENTEDSKISPLELEGAFSRYVVTLVDTSNSTTITPKANIPARDVACIMLKTEIAMHELLCQQSTPASAGEAGDVLCTGPAFTNTLPYGEFKGKTPAAVLIADTKAKDNLNKFKKSLQDNLEKYPGNKRHIDAIEQAIQLLDIGELTEATAPSKIEPAAKSFYIYKTEYKHMATKDEYGNHLIYTISVKFDSARMYPFAVEITNCYAPLAKLNNGLVQPIMEKATRLVKSSIALTDNEWVGLISHLTSVKGYFELTNFRSLLSLAMSNAYPHDNT